MDRQRQLQRSRRRAAHLRGPLRIRDVGELVSRLLSPRARASGPGATALSSSRKKRSSPRSAQVRRAPGGGRGALGLAGLGQRPAEQMHVVVADLVRLDHGPELDRGGGEAPQRRMPRGRAPRAPRPPSPGARLAGGLLEMLGRVLESRLLEQLDAAPVEGERSSPGSAQLPMHRVRGGRHHRPRRPA